MEPTTFAGVASMVAWFGVLGIVVAALNVVALRLVRGAEVPGCVECRIRWWSAHNSAFLLVSAGVAAAGLIAATTA